MKRTPKSILSYGLLFIFWFVLGMAQAQDAPPARLVLMRMRKTSKHWQEART